jgi:hypothetical protein
MSIPRRTRVLGGLAVAAAVPAVALAAKPVPGAHYSQVKGNRAVAAFDVSKDGKKVKNFLADSKCNRVPFNPTITMPISSTGRFSLNATRKSVIGKSFKVVITGKFVTKKEAKGTWRITGQGCTQKTVIYDAKFAAAPG